MEGEDMQPYRILVTGTRHNSDAIRKLVFDTLDDATFWIEPNRQIVVVHGMCPVGGVDKYADEWRARRGHQVERHPAERGPAGEFMGPARNTKMVALGADLCLGFPGPRSRGTWDCLRKAVDAGIRTEVSSVGPFLEGW